jgi:hypothetical protein
MIKTITTLTETTPFPQPQLDNIVNQCAAWQTEGKYTGEVQSTYDPATLVRHAERWAWVDNAAAQAYQSLVVSTWIDIYPDVNVDIVVE